MEDKEKYEQPECVWWNRECDKVIRIRKAKLIKWKFSKTEETFLEYKREAIIAKNRMTEIKHEHWKTFCEGMDKLTNPWYIWDRMKGLKCRFSKTERKHYYTEELVNSAKTT
jgi:hypothetical protein